MTQQTPTLAEQVIDLLIACRDLDPAVRERLVASILAGAVTPDDEKEIAAALDHEADLIGANIADHRVASLAVRAELEEASAARPAEEAAAMAAHGSALDAAAASYAAYAAGVERGVEGRMEAVVRSGEQGEMDAIRAMLAKK